MILQLTRPIVFFDLETTGTHPGLDRIVQIGLVKVRPDGSETEWESLVDPEVPIPPEATAIHGITDEMVRGKPTMRNLAGVIVAGLRDCDVGGYNVPFDVRVLVAELRRVGCPLEAGVLDGAVIDACRIFHKEHPRNLTAAEERYLATPPREDVHSALSDARASLRVLEAQLIAHEHLPRTVQALDELLNWTPEPGFADAQGKLAYRHGHLTINFGKNATKRLDQIDTRDLEWIMRNDFSKVVKRFVEDELRKRRER